MKTKPFILSHLTHALIAIETLAIFTAFAQNTFTPSWSESGVAENLIHGYRFSSFQLSDSPPATLNHVPPALTAPLYGAFQTGPTAARVTHLVVVDTQDGKFKRLFVDAAGNGDFSSVPPVEWAATEVPVTDGVITAYRASAVVSLTADGKRRGNIIFTKASEPGKINYHTDCGVTGELALGSRTLAAAIADSAGAGEIAVAGNPPPLMWIDLNGNGKLDRNEKLTTTLPFVVDGQKWSVTNLTSEGAFQVISLGKVEKKVEGPDLSPGKSAPSFAATLLGGKEVKFPDDYKGKIVLLDFWATWCGPCVAELPNVVKAYGKYHDQGLEVLGISLDREAWEQKLAAFTKKKEMPWPQVYDGKFWSAAVAKLYGINAIPHMILVDGDTGVILADNDIRGEALAPAIEKALRGQKK